MGWDGMGRIAPWANRVQPSNSKGGNWWQSPLCGGRFLPGSARTKTGMMIGPQPSCVPEQPCLPRRHADDDRVAGTVLSFADDMLSRCQNQWRSEEHTSELQSLR